MIVALCLHMSTPLEVATRGLEQAQESLKKAEKEFSDWKQANEGYDVTHPKYLELKEAVKECRARENQYLAQLPPVRGNCN